MPVSRKEIVAKVNAAFAENNVEGFLACCADDVEWTIVGERTVTGKEAIRGWLTGMDQAAPQFTVHHVMAEDDYAVAYGDMTMDEKDEKAVPYSYCDVYRFDGDTVAELKSFVVSTKGK